MIICTARFGGLFLLFSHKIGRMKIKISRPFV